MRDYPIQWKRPHDQRPRTRPGHSETTIKKQTLQVERKRFLIAVKENHIGKFVRIVENGGTRRSATVIPESGWYEFAQSLKAMVAALNAKARCERLAASRMVEHCGEQNEPGEDCSPGPAGVGLSYRLTR
jgi:hypothetical protein